MPTTARVVVLEGDFGVCAIQELELPDPGPHQAVLEIYAAGIEHGQLQQVEEPQPLPVIPGREGTARVLEVGSEVTRCKVGDVVLITPWSADSGREPELPLVEFDDGTETEVAPAGSWGTNLILDEQFVVPIPNLMDKEGASVLGNTTLLAVSAVRTAGVGEGDSVAVFGCAGVGLSTIAAAAAAGAGAIIAVARDDERLEAATAAGATETLNLSSAAAVERIAELAPGGVDHLFDCVYEFETASRPGRTPVRDGGSALVVGLPGTEERQDELDAIVAAGGYTLPDPPSPDEDVPVLLEWIEDGRLPIATIVTFRCTIEQVNEATALLEAGDVVGQAVMVVEPLR
ncbi:MAG: zinc-binding dehydrogenase [Chloroflexi bacterium]|nr:zinc-binding dehydrogenase [Chloroflexota bacterium]